MIQPAPTSAQSVSWRTCRVETPMGILTLTFAGPELLRLTLPPDPSANPWSESDTLPRGTCELPAWCARALDDFFAQRPLNNLRIRPSGSLFQKTIWETMRHIEPGQVCTYGVLAQRAGFPKAARAVGGACGKNPIPLLIPCHRVVAKTSLGGFSAGMEWKKVLLAREGLGPF